MIKPAVAERFAASAWYFVDVAFLKMTQHPTLIFSYRHGDGLLLLEGYHQMASAKLFSSFSYILSSNLVLVVGLRLFCLALWPNGLRLLPHTMTQGFSHWDPGWICRGHLGVQEMFAFLWREDRLTGFGSSVICDTY